MMNDFSLTGETLKNESEKWGARVVLCTPDGRTTTMESGFIFTNEDEARMELQVVMNEVLNFYQQNGAEVVNVNEGKLQ